jgi:hypothetical protein
MKRLYSVCLLALLATASVRAADINIRISVKFIVNAAGTMPCCGNGNFDAFEDITNQVNVANEFLRSTGRGYGLQIAEVTTVGGPATNYYRLSRDDKEVLEAAAEANKSGFKWRDNAVNMYVNDANGSAVCSFPPEDDILLFGQESRTTSLWHESGHYFNLSHTHSGQTELNSNGTTCTNECSCAVLVGGNNDGCPDTLADHTCWDTQNQIAQGNYGANYNSLTAAQRDLVDNTAFNIMSYHGTRDRMTADQFDRWTDAANTPRNHVVTGNTRFVDRNAGAVGVGSSTSPYKTVVSGVNAADSGGGDIVLLRPGQYNESLTISKRVVLRATRGNAEIGRP